LNIDENSTSPNFGSSLRFGYGASNILSFPLPTHMAVSPRTSTKTMPRETSTKSKMAAGETAPSQEPAGESTIGTGRPDKAVYDAEQNKLRSEIDALQAKFVGHPC
jgi:hypothetical protein